MPFKKGNLEWKKRKFFPKTHKGAKGINLSSLNGRWKGEGVGYNALHRWIKNRKTKIELCETCKIKKAIDLANISGEYKRDINDFRWLCRRCHMSEDGRINNLYRKRKNGS